MDRNEETYFTEDTIIEGLARSNWENNWIHKTTFDTGYLIPFYWNPDIPPASTVKLTTAIVLRQSTPKFPVMDNMYLDVFYFKVDTWTIFDKLKALFGENEDGAWAVQTEYQKPTITNTGVYSKNDLATYLGIPQNVANTKFIREGINAYIAIYNNWFRDQNLIAPITIDKTETDLTTDGSTTGVDIQHGFGLLKAARMHDYFSSCLPEPIKGTPIQLAIGTTAPIKGNGMTLGLSANDTNWGLVSNNINGITALQQSYGTTLPSTHSGGTAITAMNNIGITTDSEKSGMVADLTAATKATLTAIRDQFAVLHILENDARFGTRYKEILRGHYGAIATDESLGIPEYLGGQRIPINITEVLQTSSTDATSPLGQTGAMSETFYLNKDFTKSITKHCIIMGILVVRTDKTYQYGIARKFQKRRRYEIYTPELAHISNTPVYNGEIYWQGTSTDLEVFGYQEAWAEIKYPVNIISGELSSLYATPLDQWHYAEEYNSLPVLSQDWIEEPLEPVDRTLLLTSDSTNQFIADIMVTENITAPIPYRTTPGLTYL